MSLSITRRHAAATLTAAAALGLARPTAAVPSATTEPLAETWDERIDLATAFSAVGTRGVFVVYDAPTRRWITSDGSRAFVRHSPASTFKIVGTLIGLETGVVSGPDEVFRWDGVRRDRAELNRDLTLAQAYQVSAVWVYQAIARRVGPAGMRAWMHQLRYGSADVGAPAAHDRFWLEGPLAIAATEQVDFLRRLSEGRLPMAATTLARARTVMRRDSGPGWQLFAKTGWTNANNKGVALGWFVGWVEREGGARSCFALNLDIATEAHGAARISLALKLLAQLGLLEAAATPK
ncbi:MAG: class D beta-lactamase [Proteobacteria bacterium]|nr:class D beta-lactamase [Pseudomonadota bacterium]